MREILFRGKRVYNGEWTYGCYVEAEKLDKSGTEYFIIEKAADGSSHMIIPETLTQWTGLKDEHDKPIFEGDIVEGYFDHKKIRGYIFYGSQAKFFVQRKGLYGIELNNAEDWIEVIGNIHDNPELVEVEK